MNSPEEISALPEGHPSSRTRLDSCEFTGQDPGRRLRVHSHLGNFRRVLKGTIYDRWTGDGVEPWDLSQPLIPSGDVEVRSSIYDGREWRAGQRERNTCRN